MAVIITKIEPQKKRKDRYSVYADEQFLVGISQDTLIKYNLHVGRELDTSEINKIKSAESELKIRDQAYRYLSRRAHSCKELYDKLIIKEYSPSAINNIIDEFISNGYLNDTEFTKIFITEEIKLKKSGPLLIKNKLIKKGVNREIIDDLLSSLYDENEQVENCSYLVLKKYKRISREQKKAVINYLRNKGYYWEQISLALPQILWEENNEE